MRTIIVLLFVLCCTVVVGNNELSEQDKLKFDYYFLESIRLKEKGEITNAYNTLNYALSINEKSAAALNEISQYYFMLEELDLGLETLEKSVKSAPDNFEYQMALASVYALTDKNTEAISMYEDLIKEHPDKVELYIAVLDLYLQPSSLNINKAIEALNALENNIGVNEYMSLQKFRLYILNKEEDKAINEINELIEKFPYESKYHIILGDYYFSKENKELALDSYKKAHELNPDNSDYYSAMVNYYLRDGNIEAAKVNIEYLLTNKEIDVEEKMELLDVYIQTLSTDEDLNKAETLLKTMTELHPEEKDIYILYGHILLELNKTEEAKVRFKAATELDAADLNAWLPLVNIIIKENNIDEIIKVCSDALVYLPEYSTFYFYKATAYLLKSDYNNALETYKKGLEYIPEDNPKMSSTFYGQMGDIYFSLGKKQEAYNSFEKSLEYNPNNILILNNYAYWLSTEKRELEKAAKMSLLTITAEPDNSTYLDTYAWILFQQGEYASARMYIEKAIEKDITPGWVLLDHYGDILYKLGEVDFAVSQWEKAITDIDSEKESANKKLLEKKIKKRKYYEK
ncbi:tetratricopeptide (TPR) repeat protein [Dysgonomonadaceae bacterium PH5-43]|nr:tetratricopeptide (TPR) repeat protein [Dysgonomonadaceae bacterium PH5-43]